MSPSIERDLLWLKRSLAVLAAAVLLLGLRLIKTDYDLLHLREIVEKATQGGPR